MKKQVKICFILIILVNLTLSFNTKGTFEVEEGQILNYTVEKAGITAIISDDNNLTRMGFSLANQHFDEGSHLEVNVTEVTNEYLNYSASVGAVKEYQLFPKDCLFNIYSEHMFLIGDIGGDIAEYGNESFLFNEGMPITALIGTPIIPVNQSTWNHLTNLPDQIAEILSTMGNLGIKLKVLKNVLETSDEYSFEWLLAGSYKITAEKCSFSMENRIRMVFEKATGIMKGFRLYGELEGLVWDVEMEVVVECLVQLDDYQIPEFQLTDFIGLAIFD